MNIARYFKKTAKKYILLHLGAVFLFALMYWFPDFINDRYPNLIPSKKLKKELGYRPNAFWYYLWFSLITQTTVGYSGVITRTGDPLNMMNADMVFIITNTIQLASLFVIPVLSFV